MIFVVSINYQKGSNLALGKSLQGIGENSTPQTVSTE